MSITQNKWNARFTSGALFAACLMFAANAHADRRSSLAGNALISDQDDMYVFPQLTLDHRNLVSFDYFPGATLQAVLSGGPTSGPSNNTQNGNNVDVSSGGPNQLGPFEESSQGLRNGQASMGGSGLILFGEENFAFGISSHREDIFGSAPNHYLGVGDLQLYGQSRNSAWGFLGPNGPTPGQLSGSAGGTASANPGLFVEPLQLADILLGFGLGGGNSLGARLSIGQSSFSNRTRAAGDVDNRDQFNTTAIGLALGFSMDSSVKLDLGIELGLAFFSNTFKTNQNVPDFLDNGSLAPSFSLHGRSLVPLRESVALGVLGIIHVNSSKLTDQTPGVDANGNPIADEFESNALNFFIELGAGPQYELPDSTTISAYATTGFGATNSDTADRAIEVSTTALLLPGFKLALEHYIWDWLAFRSGVSSRYYFTFQTRNFEDPGQPNVQASSTYYEFLWSVGLGFDMGNFELNGTFQTPFVTNGPFLVSGAPSAMWGLLNATYKF